MADNSGNIQQDILLGINVTGTEQIKEAQDAVGALGKEIDKTGNKDIGTNQFKNYRQLIREATYELQKTEQQFGKNSQQFIEGAKQLGDLKLKAQEFNQTIQAFNPANKFAAFSSIARGLSGTLMGISGGMVALGFNSEKSAENMARLQGLMMFGNALKELEQVKAGFLDFGRVIKGLFMVKQQDVTLTQAQVDANAEVLASTEALNAATAERIAAEIALAEATTAANQLEIETQEALNAAKLEGLDADASITGAEQAYIELAAERATALEVLTAAQEAYNTALATEAELQGAATTASEAQTVANAANAATTGAAAVATNVFGLALKGIGIGLIIAAIVALVENWDKVKAGFESMFPVLKNTKDGFQDFMQVINGVGNAVLHYLKVPIDYAVSSVKVLIDVFKGDFKGAAQDFKDGLKSIADDLNVIDNYKKGYAAKAADYAEQERVARTQKEIEANERIIKERKALGEDTTNLEIKNQQLKNSILDKNDKDYQKKYLDGQSEISVLENQEIKKRNDAAEKLAKERANKAAQQLKSDLNEIKKNNDEALKVIAEGSGNLRNKELTDLDIKYKKEFDLLEKRKKDVKDYNAEYANLVTAKKDEEAKINKKFDDQIQQYLQGVTDESSENFDKKIAAIKKKVDDLLKNATPEEAAALKVAEGKEIDKVNNDKAVNAAEKVNKKAQSALGRAEDKDKPKDTDTPEEAKTKIEALTQARLDAENAAYNLNKLQLQGHQDEIEELEKMHQSRLTKIKEQDSEARKNIDKAERESQLKMYDAIGSAADAASGVLGENTIAHKALAVAGATISTYSSIAKTLDAYAGIPIPGYAIAQAIAMGIEGMAQVKNILSVQVPTTKSKGSTGGQTVAPVINSTVLQQTQTGTQDIVSAVNQKNQQQQNIRAFIVQTDLEKQQAKSAYYNQQSTF